MRDQGELFAIEPPTQPTASRFWNASDLRYFPVQFALLSERCHTACVCDIPALYLPLPDIDAVPAGYA